MKQMKGPKPECVTLLKKFSSRDRVVTAYEVRDKPSVLKAEEWGRVVAVFVLGKEWQFKYWPFKDHVEIFNKILGFYMRFEDDSVESTKIVKQWNVMIISATIPEYKAYQEQVLSNCKKFSQSLIEKVYDLVSGGTDNHLPQGIMAQIQQMRDNLLLQDVHNKNSCNIGRKIGRLLLIQLFGHLTILPLRFY